MDKFREHQAYRAFLSEKVETARKSMRAGEGRSNEEVEKEFAARRAKAATLRR